MGYHATILQNADGRGKLTTRALWESSAGLPLSHPYLSDVSKDGISCHNTPECGWAGKTHNPSSLGELGGAASFINYRGAGGYYSSEPAGRYMHSSLIETEGDQP